MRQRWWSGVRSTPALSGGWVGDRINYCMDQQFCLGRIGQLSETVANIAPEPYSPVHSRVMAQSAVTKLQ
ncbi:hypothetical protein V6N13_021577 [Hibiscus sabdariffa]|uniref:Uncharacterized protein n=1 Tax=Hibiscus sabdariffa TaxID=183260 RepID=A0ABR2B9K7_9ROSI